MTPLVSVAVLTYNSEGTIRQCIDSILMQETDFDYEIVVGDDCSIDGTQDVLREYKNCHPDKFTLLLNERNEGISKNYQRVLTHCRGEYVALCEGDDYWTDECKLRKQVAFLESHVEYGFVGTYSQLLLSDGQIKEDFYDYMPKLEVVDGWELYGDVFDYAKVGPVTRTVSLCFRRSIIVPYLQYEGLGNDLVIQTVLSKHSWFAKYSQAMTIYRQGGVSTDKMSFEKQLYYNDWYVGNRLLQKQLFPDECNWNEAELSDRGDYIRLKKAICERDWKKALEIKHNLRTEKYRKKRFAKFLLGPLSCFVCSLVVNQKNYE